MKRGEEEREGKGARGGHGEEGREGREKVEKQLNVNHQIPFLWSQMVSIKLGV